MVLVFMFDGFSRLEWPENVMAVAVLKKEEREKFLFLGFMFV